MKVLLVTDFFYPHWTGISKSIGYFAESLQEEFDFTVLTVQYQSDLKRNEVMGKIQVLREPYVFKLSRVKYSFSLLKTSLRLIRKNDVILINSPCSNILPISLFTKLFGKKLLIFYQGDLILPQSISNRIIQKTFDLMTFIGFSMADNLATYTYDYASNSRLLPAFKEKTKVVKPPLPYFKTDFEVRFKKHSDLYEKLQRLKKDKYLIGFAGRFVEEKGFDILLQAMTALIDKRTDIHFVFAGETNIEYEDHFAQNLDLVNKLKGNLTLLGLLNQSELSVFYQQLDLFLLPSRSECFGLVQAEAMAGETPVIVSDIPGARDIVKHTNYGLVFKDGSIVDLKRAISQAIDELSSFSKHYPNVVKYFDYERTATEAAEFIEGGS